MRVVIDTNVFVSGVFWRASPSTVLEAWRDDRIELVLSPAILGEYQRVATELNRRFPAIDLNAILDILALSWAKDTDYEPNHDVPSASQTAAPCCQHF